MRNSVQITLVATIALWSFIPVQPYAQGSQWCPPAGTVTTAKNNNGAITTTHKGADPSDPAICVAVSEGQGTSGLIYGKPIRRLYGWYDLTTNGHDAETERLMREGLGAILSGRLASVNYKMMITAGSFAWSGNEAWQRAGEATLSIGGRPTKVIALRETFVGQGNSNYDGYTDTWYDPKLHMFVKGETHLHGGPVARAIEVTSVTLP